MDDPLHELRLRAARPGPDGQRANVELVRYEERQRQRERDDAAAAARAASARAVDPQAARILTAGFFFKGQDRRTSAAELRSLADAGYGPPAAE